MGIKTFGLAVFIAMAYVAWPNLAIPLKLKPGVVPFMVILVALVVVVILAPRDIAELRSISTRAFLVVLGFSIANGLAIYLYANTAADKSIHTGMFLATVFILQVVFAPVADWLVTGMKPSALQYVGLGLAVPVIWLLSQRY